jgi:hypothetical protein
MVDWSDVRYAALDVIEPTISRFTSTRPLRWYHVHYSLSLFHQFWGKTDKPYSDLLHNEASRRMSTNVLTPSLFAHRFWGGNRQTSSSWFWGPKLKTITILLRPKSPTCCHRFDAKSENPCFSSAPRVRYGSHTASPNLPIIRPPSTRLVSNHPDPPHQFSYSCLDPRRCLSCRVRHLHIMRQAIAFL